MNCASVLEALLVAEPSELAAEGNTTLAEHLHSCARCRRVAGQLLVDTRLLSTAMQASRVAGRRLSRPPYVLAPVGLVATLLVVAVLRTPGEVRRADDQGSRCYAHVARTGSSFRGADRDERACRAGSRGSREASFSSRFPVAVARRSGAH